MLAGRIQNAVQQFYKLLWLFSWWNSKTDFPTLSVDGKFRSRLLFLDIRLQNVTRKLSFSCEQCTTVHGIISFHRGTYYYSLPLLLFQKPSIDFFLFHFNCNFKIKCCHFGAVAFATIDFILCKPVKRVPANISYNCNCDARISELYCQRMRILKLRI